MSSGHNSFKEHLWGTTVCPSHMCLWGAPQVCGLRLWSIGRWFLHKKIKHKLNVHFTMLFYKKGAKGVSSLVRVCVCVCDVVCEVVLPIYVNLNYLWMERGVKWHYLLQTNPAAGHTSLLTPSQSNCHSLLARYWTTSSWLPGLWKTN